MMECMFDMLGFFHRYKGFSHLKKLFVISKLYVKMLITFHTYAFLKDTKNGSWYLFQIAEAWSSDFQYHYVL